MKFPRWYTDFWCPDEMREFDPQGCGIGLGIGMMLALLVALAVIVALVMVVAYLWPVKHK